MGDCKQTVQRNPCQGIRSNEAHCSEALKWLDERPSVGVEGVVIKAAGAKIPRRSALLASYLYLVSARRPFF